MLGAREAGAHEDVEHVMNAALGVLEGEAFARRQRPREVRMTAVVIVAAVEQPVRIGVAARADDVVHPGPVRVEPVPVERVARDRRRWG